MEATKISVETAVQLTLEELSDRCLSDTTAWLSELLLSASPEVLEQTVRPPPAEPRTESRVKTRMLLARSLFQTQEFRRAHHVLAADTGNPKCAFLAYYALYMEGERNKLTNGEESGLGRHKAANAQAAAIRGAVEEVLSANSSDAYLHWLFGLVLKELHEREMSFACFERAVVLNPLLWCAWQELAKLIQKDSQITELMNRLDCEPCQFPWMRDVFVGVVRSELQQYVEAKMQWETLLTWFPSNSYFHLQLANAMYQRKEFEVARTEYEAVHRADPYRLEGLDEYSNALFIKGDRLELSALAVECMTINPFSTVSNCIAGNYYAMHRRHEKSLMHFRRAVAIDPRNMSAWTLMGHEYLEVKNSHAAVEAYRTAVEIDQRDYRAWYGLGQTYELLQMYLYALHYYWHTTTLRPNDARMWTAVAGCLEKQSRQQEALSCLERAEAAEPAHSEFYPQLVRRIAEHYVAINSPKALIFYEKLAMADRVREEDLERALPYLAERHCAQAKELLNVPNRSPSFEPSAQCLQAAFCKSMERPSTENRHRSGLKELARAEEYLLQLEQLVAVEQPMSGATATDLAQLRGDPLQGTIARLKSDIEYTKRFLETAK